jgi:hypothetical protein
MANSAFTLPSRPQGLSSSLCLFSIAEAKSMVNRSSTTTLHQLAERELRGVRLSATH